ncbi:MAG: hypothetical protein MUD10_01100 [Candidatus Pacebacteria bacterium]|nr:hypothetical protein [Candidatus Paceibacterota bacterium]
MCLVGLMPALACTTCGDTTHTTTPIVNSNENTNINIINVEAIGMKVVKVFNIYYIIKPDGTPVPLDTDSGVDGRKASGTIWFNENGRAKQLNVYSCEFLEHLQPPCNPAIKMA